MRLSVLALVVGSVLLPIAQASGQATEVQKLLPASGDPEDWFGHAVAISGDVAVVGAILDDQVGSDSGSATVYHFDGAVWVEEQLLVPASLSAGDQFGRSIAVDGDVILIGSWLPQRRRLR